jgi:hypothetical protein
MASLAELVEAPADWLSPVRHGYEARRLLRVEMQDADEWTERVLIGCLDTLFSWESEQDRVVRKRRGHAGPVKPKPYPSTLGERFLCEIHELLCQKSEKYEDDRKRLRKDFRVGEAGLVAGVTATISPYLGGSAIMVAPAVAITFTIIGRAGLATWCAQMTAGRQRAEELFELEMKQYEAALEEYESRRRFRDGPSLGR